MKTASVAVLALLVASPALAQTTTPAPAPSAPPAATAPSGNLNYYKHTPGQMRASKLVGTNVKNQANETIGEINELILDKDGKVAYKNTKVVAAEGAKEIADFIDKANEKK